MKKIFTLSLALVAALSASAQAKYGLYADTEIMKAENLELGDRNLPELGEGITVTSEEIKDAVNIISERIKKLEETEAASNPKESEETADKGDLLFWQGTTLHHCLCQKRRTTQIQIGTGILL